MATRMRSYTDLGGSGAVFIDSWKEKGLLKVWLHRDPGWVRRIHNFRQVVVEEGKDNNITKKVRWLPFVCWEPDAYHIARHRERDSGKARARVCPGCRLIEVLEAQNEIPDDAVVFDFYANKRDERRIVKVDLIGEGGRHDSFKDDLTAQQEYLIFVIPADDEKPTIKIANERYGLMKKLRGRIDKDRQLIGDDEGNPSRTPICYTFEVDKGPPTTYTVARFAEAKLTNEIRELWESDPPDVESYADPGDPEPFYKAAHGALVDEFRNLLDLDDIFGPARQAWAKKNKKEPDDTSFDTDELEGRRRDDDRRSARDDDRRDERRSTRDDDRRSARDDDRRDERRSTRDDDRRSTRDDDRRDERRESERERRDDDRSETERSLPEDHRSRRRVEPEPGKRSMGDEMGVETISCPDCGSDWEISSHDKCPHCGCKRSSVRIRETHQVKEPEPSTERSEERRDDDRRDEGGARSRNRPF